MANGAEDPAEEVTTNEDCPVEEPGGMRNGSVTMPHTSESAPPTAIPIKRNGRSISHTMGYKTSAASAKGQHRTNRMHHKRKANMRSLQKRIRSTRQKVQALSRQTSDP